MEHSLLAELISAAFLLFLGGTRCYYVVAARTRPGDASRPGVDRSRQMPAYAASAAWAAFVVCSVLAPARLLEWDRWPVGHGVSDLLVWAAAAFLGAGLGLFWYSHRTIGSYWSIRIEIKMQHQLVTDGAYRYMRHPLYTALFLGYLGTLLALQSWTLTAWFPVFVVSYVLFAKEEEGVMESGFGDAYRVYRERTGMFFPLLTRPPASIARDASGDLPVGDARHLSGLHKRNSPAIVALGPAAHNEHRIGSDAHRSKREASTPIGETCRKSRACFEGNPSKL